MSTTKQLAEIFKNLKTINGEPIVAEGGGDLEITSTFQLNFLVIGGGGAGKTIGAGGGAGGYRCSMEGEFSGGLSSPEPSYKIVTSADYYVEIGAGSNGQGNDTIFGKIRSKGGGSYVGNDVNGVLGGSGSGTNRTALNASHTIGGAGIALQGFKGGDTKGHRNSTGGGGAGEAGADTVTNDTGTKGGDGLESNITGTPTFRAGGGTGAYISGVAGGGGGLGGGGGQGGNGVANTGSGGGGKITAPAASGNGGSGVVIIRYPSDYEIIDELDSTLGLTFTTTTVGNDKVTVFTQGIGNIQFNKV